MLHREVDRNAELTNRAWLKAPSHKGAECRVVKNDMSCALLHSGSRDLAGSAVDLQDGNPSASHVPGTSFKWILGSRSPDRGGFRNRRLRNGARVERHDKDR